VVVTRGGGGGDNDGTQSVLGCKFADDVLIDAPRVVSAEMIASLEIGLVVSGDTHEGGDADITPCQGRLAEPPPHAVPKQMGIFQEVPVKSTLTVDTVVQRILEQEETHRTRYKRKSRAEAEYYSSRYSTHSS
jgi:ethanolamine-phosphate cytidylyltransferase